MIFPLRTAEDQPSHAPKGPFHPGQSGNPGGRRLATVTRHIPSTEMSPAPARPGALRMRRLRQRRREGAVRIEFAVVTSALDAMVACSWLTPEQRGDREAVRRAVVKLARLGLALVRAGLG
jgi:hypothetical protein